MHDIATIQHHLAGLIQLIMSPPILFLVSLVLLYGCAQGQASADGPEHHTTRKEDPDAHTPVR
jgi:hypothetical protein